MAPGPLMEEAVSRGWAAFSQAEALRRNIEWLDLVCSDEVKRKLVPLVEAFERDAYRSASLRSLVITDEARKRWAVCAENLIRVDAVMESPKLVE
jgi:hypothetical protein